MSISQNFPNLSPSLSLDFASVKKLDPRITFSRASSAVVYDGKTVAKAEENLLLQSQTFNVTPWSNVAVTVAIDATNSPDGTTTAEQVTGNGASANHWLIQNFSDRNSLKVFSIYAKANDNNYIQVLFGGDSTLWANFDLSTGVIGSTGTNITASIVNAGSGWYRCICAITSTTASQVYVALATSATDTRAQANTLTTSVYLWGAQLEQRSSVTAYTPTTTQPITNYIPTLLTAPANVARFEHNPVTGESLGFLVEEQRTNLLTYSQDQSDTSWVANANAIKSPNTYIGIDGTLSATLIELPASGDTFTKAVTIGTAGNHIGSFWVKTPDNSTASFLLGISGGNITVTATGQWTRVTTNVLNLGAGGRTLTITYTSAPCKIVVWGFQVEAGAFPTSYIKTEASQVTRAADSASMTGSNFSEWYRADEGTLYGEYSVKSTASVYTYSLGTYTNGIIFRPISGQNMLVRKNNVTQAQIGLTTFNTDTYYKQIGTYAFNDIATCANNGAVTTDALAEIPVITDLYLASVGAGTYGSFYFKKLSFYPTRLSNLQLQSLTS